MSVNYDFLETSSEHLLGIEYVVILHNSHDNKLIYFCVLCKKEYDVDQIIKHLISHRHRTNYLKIYFPSLLEFLESNHKFNTNISFHEETIKYISKEFEQHFYRQKPLTYEFSEFESRKSQITDEIKSLIIFNKNKLVDMEKNLLEKFKNDEIAAETSDDEIDGCENNKKKLNRVSRFADKREPQMKSSTLQYQSMPNLTYHCHEKIISKNLEQFKIEFKLFYDKHQNNYEYYKINLNEHPVYSDEWKKFWSHRYKQLTLQGKDANKHEYVPEWFAFWPTRMNKIRNEEIKKKIQELKEKYQISDVQAKEIEHQVMTAARSPKRQCFESSDECNDEPSPSMPEIKIDSLNLITLCRFLLLLSNELGMLTSKINDLLNCSRAMENSCEILLHQSENIILLCTVKEKFKGGLAANLVKSDRIMPVKRAITCIAKLIHDFNQKHPNNENSIKFEKVENFSFEKQSDDDLKIFLRNFSELTSEEQKQLNEYLSNLETMRGDKLRKYINMGDMEVDEDQNDVEMAENK